MPSVLMRIYIKVMGEFGGHGWPVQGHLWDNSRRNWGYGGLPQSRAEYKERYLESLNLLIELKEKRNRWWSLYSDYRMSKAK